MALTMAKGRAYLWRPMITVPLTEQHAKCTATHSSPWLPSRGATTMEPSHIPESSKDRPFNLALPCTKYTVPKEVLFGQVELRFPEVSQCSLLRTICIICEETFC